ncbi:TadE/TadG family type IV pilus assembly protein [Pacificibacter marinus]|uniref:TadE/TadG family type IV pilus assembly protein n=1 Tax=Pacificibacter marinus TaxID=658057 RepID=UPI001C06A981|nr:TadE family protein [Pacificibacter marinus]MBU2867062.1 pilus assembly protein [Pacificibacter marinus]
MSILSRLKHTTRFFAKDDCGSATMEFSVLFPIFVFILMGGYEIGYYTVSSTMLDRGLDMAVRDVRLGLMEDVDLPTLKNSVCRYATYIRNCEENIHIALEPVVASGFVIPSSYAECIDRAEDVTPATTFSDGDENELMLVRACVNIDPIFPTTWLGAQLESYEGSGIAMVSTAAFVNEPNT